MLVKNWMSKEVITIDVNDSMDRAGNLLKDHNIRTLPVMKKGKLAGVITDRDLKRASASDANTLKRHELSYLLSEIKIAEIMTRDPVTVPPDYTVEETAEVLFENRISGVPVVEMDELVGIITKDDLFRVLVALTAERKKGIQFAFQVEAYPGSIKELVDIIRKYGGRLISILSSNENAKEGYRSVYIRVHKIDREKLSEIQEELKERATLLYMVDHRENKRWLYL
ncbi:MAG: CBS domain-containing protein [Deltaproteobacteria bacterium]|nr:CBS domain-containing protein [Deltaproteobacteria bacterium]